MHAAAALTWAFALVVGIAGVAKIISPWATGAALEGAKLPSDARLVRALGVGEVVLAAAVLLLGGPAPAAVLAAAYATFTVFAYRQSRRGEGCGCFGEADAPATTLHVAIDAAGAGAAGVAALTSAPTPLAVAADPAQALLVGGLVVVAGVLLRMMLTALPELVAAMALHAEETGS